MRKPTAVQFFAAWSAIWLSTLVLICVYSDTRGNFGLPVLFLKISIANIGFAVLNILGAIIGISTGFWPWRDQS